jgi:hypothetical protein
MEPEGSDIESEHIRNAENYINIRKIIKSNESSKEKLKILKLFCLTELI